MSPEIFQLVVLRAWSCVSFEATQDPRPEMSDRLTLSFPMAGREIQEGIENETLTETTAAKLDDLYRMQTIRTETWPSTRSAPFRESRNGIFVQVFDWGAWLICIWHHFRLSVGGNNSRFDSGEGHHESCQ